MYNNRRRYNESQNHIQDDEMYRDAIRHLKWNNGKGHGERWKINDLIESSGIDFDREEYTPHDYAYAVNAHYADYGDLSENPEYYMQMAKNYLRNNSFPERPEERAYHDAMRRSRKTYSRYDDYPVRPESNNRYDYYSPRNEYRPYEYDNRRRYNERNTYRDRDNDGRYYE